MRHLSEGTLRRLCDEPLTLSESERRHLERCERCQEQQREIRRSAGEAASLLAVEELAVHALPALSQLHHRLRAQEIVPRPRWQQRVAETVAAGGTRLVRPLGGVAAALALVGAVTLTPAGSLAQSFISVFQPTQVAVVPVTSAELRSLPNLRKYGTVHLPQQVPSQQASSLQSAETLSGMHVVAPGSLPAGIPTSPSYEVIPGETASFTFSAAKAQQAAAAAGKPAPTMPANIDGSTLQIKTGAAVVAIYGPTGQMPDLVIGQMKAPTVSTTQVSAQELESYILSLPGVSPQLRSALQAVGDPSTTLPLPIPVALGQAQTVQVDGVQGLEVGDNTGIGSAVIWEKHGMVHGVGGTIAESEALSIASTLK